MPNSHQSEPTQGANHNPERPSFRKAPWFILREGSPASNGASLVFSVLWAAIKDLSSPEGLITRPVTNKEIAERSGIRGGPQAALKHLQNLERAGAIRRYGLHRNRTFEILFRPSDNDYQGLTIPEDIFLSNLNPTQKLLATTIRAFPKAGKRWICQKIGISDWTYYHNIKQVEPYKESNTNPIKNLTEPYKESNPIGIVGTDSGIGRLDKSNLDGPLAQDGCLGDHPPLKGGVYMSRRIPYKTPAQPGWYEQQLRRLILQNAHVGPTQDFQKKKSKFRPPTSYPAEVLTDMAHIEKELPFVHSPKRDTRAYDDDAKVILALTNGPANSLRPDELQAILAKMNGCHLGRCTHPVSAASIKKWFFDRRFTQAERRELYKRLNDAQSAEYGGKGKKVGLAWAMRTHSGWSWLAALWLAPPRPARYQEMVDLVPIEEQLELAVDILPDRLRPDQRATLARNISALKGAYDNDFRHRLDGLGYEGRLYQPWHTFFKNLAAFFEDRENLNIGWFKPGSRPVGWFLDEIGAGGPARYARSGL